MGFLSGVLGAVKNENEVETYDKHLNKRLNEVLKEVNKNIGSGSDGLAASVGAVKGWLEGYEGKVREYNEKVSGPINSLLLSIDACKSEIDMEKDRDIADQIAAWTMRAKDYIKQVESAEGALEDIDSKLKDKLKCPIHMLLQATKTFGEEARNRDLEEIYDFTNLKLTDLSKYVDSRFYKRTEELRIYLTGQIRDLYRMLEEFKRCQFYDLQSFVSQDLHKAFVSVFDEIKLLQEMYGEHIVPEVQNILRDALAVKDKVASEKKATITEVNRLEQQILELGGASSDVSYKVTNEVNVLQNDTALKKLLIVLKSQIETNMENYLNKLKGALEAGMGAATKFYGQSRSGVSVLGNHMKHNEIFPELGEKLVQLANTKSPDPTNLENALHYLSLLNRELQPPNSPSEIYENIKKALKQRTTAVDYQLGNLIQTSIRKGIGMLQETINKNIDEHLNGIKLEFQKLKPVKAQGKSELQKNAHDLHKQIDAFLKQKVGITGNEPENTFYKHLNKLKENIETLGNKVAAVHTKVNKVGEELDKCITRIQHMLHDMPIKTEDIMTRLRESINLKIAENFRAIQNKTKELYSATKHKKLNALQEIVRKQYDAIEYVIHNNVNGGTKGFMKRLQVYFVDKIEDHATKLASDLKSPSSHPGLLAEQKTLEYFSNKLKNHFHLLLQEVSDSSVLPHLTPLSTKLETLLKRISKSKHFDYLVSDKYEDLQNALDNFAPKKFGDLDSPLLAPLKSGLSEFAAQLGHAYVSRYSGKHFNGALVTKSTTKKPAETQKQDALDNYDLTPEGRNCAKVCLTIVEMVMEEMAHLKSQCPTNYSSRPIYLRSGPGALLKKMGFVVASEESKQDGQLQNTATMTGDRIGKLIGRKIDSAKNNTHLPKCKDHDENELAEKTPTATKSDFHIMDVLDCLFRHLRQYNEVCHFATFKSTKTPCSVYEMLAWCTGLPYNKAYAALLSDGVNSQLDDPDETVVSAEGDLDIAIYNHQSSYLNAYPNAVTYNCIDTVVSDICSMSHEILITILGTGDEYTTYACEFSNNSIGLKYPASGEDCLDMFLDILRRLFPVLQFIHSRCKVGDNHFGWRECYYGKDIQTTKWPCTDHSTDKAACQANCQPTCQPNCQVNCHPASPLQSYLNDCLPGHLPHQLITAGCKAVCKTCPSSTPGMPCLTPCGFRGFSGSKRRGDVISNVLSKFFDITNLASLFCLVPTPPKTLPEHFNFAVSLVREWEAIATLKFEKPIETSIDTVSIGLCKKPRELTDALRYVYGSSQNDHGAFHPNPMWADVSSLCMRKKCYGIDERCAPYIQSVCYDAYYYLAYRHSDIYLSWAVYLPWTFWSLLNNLYNAFCNINCQDWGCRGCLRGDKCKKGDHGSVDDKTKKSNCQCSSIVTCKGVSPTLYRYGFRFGDASSMNDGKSTKTCSDFCTQLKRVLNSKYFKELFIQCDKFLFTIRAPFIWLNVALWLLSLLYLLHIMVIRLDLLHIKSHLRSPSSHRIAAQSLLAAARVNKLGKVFYLQP
ncbi:hypothetical protein, conserved [Babesia bigemina]|uniref:C3H1-type domain-containing protein n=1 Tax=Babesia bigemina TaxID=5866 RepID=A0A061BLK9_BABBI|nr:hypothetical protein, conserved [Babesia bigemina]CDR71761.1 hypothetical protein, conserved [Babesia bigemina]|eukprot:XP_012770706.1 hypothetical protein, conserved [Babesia bigemina]